MSKEIKIVSADEIVYMLKEKYGDVDIKFIIAEKRIQINTSNNNHCIVGQVFDGAELTSK